MSNVTNGVVEAVRKDSKGLMIAGSWYSSFNAFSGIMKSDVVSFSFVEKGQWKNIKGPIEKVTGVATADATSPPSIAELVAKSEELPPHYMIARGYMNKVQMFPIPADHPDRAIVRQNSLTNAVNLLTHTGFATSGGDAAEMANIAIEVAGIFEKYSTGQLEMEEAEKVIAEMTKDKDE